jgi:beta-mannosidase
MARQFLRLVALLVAIPAAAQASGYPLRMSLNGTWDYRPLARTTLKSDSAIVEDKSNLPPAGKMPVPSNWHLAGLTNFNGRVRFERAFDFSSTPASEDRVFLVFRGVDYFAEVELNGTLVGRHEGYFQFFEFDVTPQIKRGRNRLAVTVDAPLEEPGTVWPDHKRMIKGVLSHWDCKPGGVSRKFGQDGTTAGIWNDVELEVRHAAWLGNVKIQPFLYKRSLGGGNDAGAQGPPGRAPLPADEAFDAKVFVTAEVHAVKPGKFVLTAEAGGSKVSTDLGLTTPDSTTLLVLPLEHPRLWWTWDLGEPYLYKCKLALATNGETVYQREVNFGVRKIELDEKTGEWRLNGVRFFIRGTNIVPELWLSRYTPDRIAQDILLREAYINGVRVCVHVSRRELYEALDRAGILAWQDFPLQWDYTRTDEFMRQAAQQLRDMIRQFYNHPSIVTWVCQNESTAYNVNVLDPFLARVGAQEDSSRPVRPVSAFGEHLYEGWYSGSYRHYLALPGGPIISELGAQALPSVEEVREMVGDAWPPDWEKLAYHDFQYDQTFHVARVAMGSNWAEFVENSQLYQAELLKFALEHYRRAKYKTTGSLFQFQFVDCWPAVTWSVVSYARKPKLGYFAVQRAYQPVLIGGDLARTVWSQGNNGPHEDAGNPSEYVGVWVVNDEHRAIKGATYEARLRGQGKSVLLASGRATGDMAADSVADLPALRCTLPQDVVPGAYEIVLTVKEGEKVLSENAYPVTVVK